MVPLKRSKRTPRRIERACPVAPATNAITAPKSSGAPKLESTFDAELVPRPSPSLARFISPAGWLFISQNKAPCTSLRECSSAQKHISSTHSTTITPMTFRDLPTEIHFRIAAYLPGHALHILARYGYSAKLRHIYQHADPKGMRADMGYLPCQEFSIYGELCMRDDFEKTPYPHVHSSSFYRAIWSTTVFHCSGCGESVGCAHFPLDEMKESVERRTGMSKITDRKCFARITPVQLWDNRIVTWDQLQQAWADMEGKIMTPPILSDYGENGKKLPKGKHKSGRYTDVPNTLRLRDLDYAQARYAGEDARDFGIEATAEYYVDLYTPIRFVSVDATTVTTLIKQKAPYTCPHLDMTRLISRRLSENPIEFRPSDPIHPPNATVADLLCKTLDKSPWKPDPSCLHQRPDKPVRKIKEQAIWCGFQGDRCRTAVSLQRFRDNTAESTVASPWWMRDLVRLKVVRRWRVDRGTGDEDWQAQNGVSVRLGGR